MNTMRDEAHALMRRIATAKKDHKQHGHLLIRLRDLRIRQLRKFNREQRKLGRMQ